MKNTSKNKEKIFLDKAFRETIDQSDAGWIPLAAMLRSTTQYAWAVIRGEAPFTFSMLGKMLIYETERATALAKRVNEMILEEKDHDQHKKGIEGRGHESAETVRGTRAPSGGGGSESEHETDGQQQ